MSKLVNNASREAVIIERIPFPVWKTIELGTYHSVDDLWSTLKYQGYKLEDWSKMIKRFSFVLEKVKTRIDLVKVTPAALGLTEETATLQEIYKCVRGYGLKPCPMEVAPQLRLQYRNQPIGECLKVSIENFGNFNEELYAFGIEHNYGRELRLDEYHIEPDGTWFPDISWIFTPSGVVGGGAIQTFSP